MAEPLPITCEGTCTVVVQLEPAPASPEHLADYNALFGMFFLAAIVIFCARRLYNFFDSTPHESN